jgi:hypothetical protein
VELNLTNFLCLVHPLLFSLTLLEFDLLQSDLHGVYVVPHILRNLFVAQLVIFVEVERLKEFFPIVITPKLAIEALIGPSFREQLLLLNFIIAVINTSKILLNFFNFIHTLTPQIV